MPSHYLLVDGYNVIHASPELAVLAGDSLDAARKKLCDALCEFKAMGSYRIVVVFDAHLVSGGVGSVERYGNIKIVFTKEAETADNYIERAAYKLTHRNNKLTDRITVATSDVLEQLIILGQGAGRVSAADLWEEMQTAKDELRRSYIATRPIKKNPIASLIDEETAKKLDQMRYGINTKGVNPDNVKAKGRNPGKSSKRR